MSVLVKGNEWCLGTWAKGLFQISPGNTHQGFGFRERFGVTACVSQMFKTTTLTVDLTLYIYGWLSKLWSLFGYPKD